MNEDTAYSLGKLVIFDKATLLLDVYRMVRELAPQFVKERRKSTKPARILLADESHAMRAALAGYLQSCGFEVVEVSSGDATLREMRSPKFGPFDALVIDLEISGLNVLNMLATLKRDLPSLPVFAWTSSEDASLNEQALSAGARACINKMNREGLMAELHKNHVGSRRSADRISA